MKEGMLVRLNGLTLMKYIATCLTLLVLFSCAKTTNIRRLTYAELLKQVEENGVVKGVITEGRGVSGELRSGEPFRVEIQNEFIQAELAKRMQEKGIEVSFKAEDRQVDLRGGISSVWLLLGAIPGLGFWLWMLIECAEKEPSVGNDKIVWVMIIIFTNVLGALMYYIVRRRKRREVANKQGST